MGIFSFLSKFDSISKARTIISAEYYLSKEVKPSRANRIRELSRRPVIIGGCARSGTTLLLSILSCHPKILAIEEETGAFCPSAYIPSGYNPNPDLDATIDLTLIYRYLNRINISSEYELWCEKKPRNVLFIKRIINLFRERVRFIHLVRDGRDVIVSRHPQDPSKYWVNVQRWVQDVGAGKEFFEHPQVLTIRYEDLIENYIFVVGQLCEFIGVDFVDEFKYYPRNAKIIQDAAWFQQAYPLNPKSIGRWKYQVYSNRVKEIYNEPQAVDLLKFFGYIP